MNYREPLTTAEPLVLKVKDNGPGGQCVGVRLVLCLGSEFALLNKPVIQGDRRFLPSLTLQTLRCVWSLSVSAPADLTCVIIVCFRSLSYTLLVVLHKGGNVGSLSQWSMADRFSPSFCRRLYGPTITLP